MKMKWGNLIWFLLSMPSLSQCSITSFWGCISHQWKLVLYLKWKQRKPTTNVKPQWFKSLKIYWNWKKKKIAWFIRIMCLAAERIKQMNTAGGIEEGHCRIAGLVSPPRMFSFCGLVGTSYFKFLALHQGYGTMLQSYSETWLAMFLQYIFLTPR